MPGLELPPSGRSTTDSSLGPHLSIFEIANAGDITDITGVPLESDRTPMGDGIDFEYVACPYHDSPARLQVEVAEPKPMSDLERKRLTKAYPAVKQLLIATRQAYIDETRGSSSDQTDITVLDAQLILGAVQHLPDFVVHRFSNPAARHGALPVHLIVASNSASGALGAVGAYSMGDMRLRAPSGEEAVEAIEAREPDSLIGANTVCAAPPAMMRNFFSLLRDGGFVAPQSLRKATNGLVTMFDLPRLIRFGQALQQVHLLQRSYEEGDKRFVAAIKGFKSRPETIEPTITDLRGFLDAGHQHELELENILNRELGRLVIDTSQVTRNAGDNLWNLESVRLAQTRGLL